MESLVCNFYLSVAARKLVWADSSLRYNCMLLGRWTANQQTTLSWPRDVVVYHLVGLMGRRLNWKQQTWVRSPISPWVCLFVFVLAWFCLVSVFICLFVCCCCCFVLFLFFVVVFLFFFGGEGFGSSHSSDLIKRGGRGGGGAVFQWLPCQAPGIIESAPGLVGLLSVDYSKSIIIATYCDWVR